MERVVSFTSTAVPVALVCTSPIFAVLVGDRVGRREIAGIAIAAAGCAVLTAATGAATR